MVRNFLQFVAYHPALVLALLVLADPAFLSNCD